MKSKFLFASALAFAVASCGSSDKVENDSLEDLNKKKRGFFGDGIDIIDPAAGLSEWDYKDHFYKRTFSEAKIDSSEIALPKINDLIQEPKKLNIANDKMVTLSVTDDVPLKDVLIELGRSADIDMNIDPSISGGIILRVKERPFSEVIEKIASLANLRYSADGGILKIERDTPFVRHYRLNILDIIRDSSSSKNVSSSVEGGVGGGGSGGGSGGGVTGGSDSTISSQVGVSDLWSEVELGVSNILSQYNATDDSESNALSINRKTGVVSLMANQRQHEQLKEYLDYIHMSYTSQVLIEAKVLEVQLRDKYKTGIDWSLLDSDGKWGIGTNFGNVGASIANGSISGAAKDAVTGVFGPTGIFGDDSLSLSGAVDMVQQFGTTRTLSSPRLHAMNNEYALLSFTENYVYFEIEIEQEDPEKVNGLITKPGKTTVESEVQTIPIGVMLGLQPSIDLERNEITMVIRPTITNWVKNIKDPGVAYIVSQSPSASGIENLIPQVETKEVDSVLRIRSGQVMVIGGLLAEKTVNDDKGVPFISKIPVLGNAFKSVNKDTEITETVIFIKATIVPGSGVSVEDREFYRKFSRSL